MHSDNFVHSRGRMLRSDIVPSLKLPVLPTQAALSRPCRLLTWSPLPEPSNIELSISDVSYGDAAANTDLTSVDVALSILFRSTDDTLRLDFIGVQTAVKLSIMVQCSTSCSNSQGSASSLVISLSSSSDGSEYVWSCVILSSSGTNMSRKAQGWLSDSPMPQCPTRWWGCLGSNVLELPLPSLSSISLLLDARSVTGIIASVLGRGLFHSCNFSVDVRNSGIFPKRLNSSRAYHKAPMCLQLAHGPFPAGHPHSALIMSEVFKSRKRKSLYMRSFLISGKQSAWMNRCSALRVLIH